MIIEIVNRNLLGLKIQLQTQSELNIIQTTMTNLFTIVSI